MPDALLVTSSFLPGRGGIESYLAGLCDELAPRLAVFAPATRDGLDLPRDTAYETVGFAGPSRPTAHLTDEIATAARRLGTKRILFGTPWPLGLLGPALRDRGLRYAAITHAAEVFVPASVPLLNRRLITSLAGADVLFAVSNYTVERVRATIERTERQAPPTARLPVRVDLDRFSSRIDAGELRGRLQVGDRPIVLMLSRLVRRKGAHRLIAALPRLRASAPDVAVVIGGTGPEEKSLTRAAASSDGVLVIGRVAEDDAPALYAAADVFALPVVDRWGGLEVEGLGVVLLEASACETPCVTGRSGGTTEAVVDGKTGYVVDARDDHALVDAIASLLTDKQHASQMGKAAREHVRAEFSEKPLPSLLLDWLDRGEPPL